MINSLSRFQMFIAVILRSNSVSKVNINNHPLTLLTKVSRYLSTDRDSNVRVHSLNVLLNDHSNQSVVELQIFETRVTYPTILN